MKKIFILLVLFLVTTNGFSEQIQINVIRSTPIYEIITVKVSKDIQRRVSCVCNKNNTDRNSLGLDTIIGSILGVVVGNQIGRGNGRVAAKFVGGVTGGYIANQMRDNNGNCYKVITVQDNPSSYKNKRILSSYKNCGYLGNKEICKISNYKQKYIYLNY